MADRSFFTRNIWGATLTMATLMTTNCTTHQAESLRPDIGTHTLSNGFTVYTLEDRSAPLVTYEVWFRVGSSHEAEGTDGEHGTTGLSHFFEHMMFRGTKAHPRFFDEVYALGGKLNAWTWLDSTVYWEKIPSRHIHTIIEYEADRLANMEMNFLALEPEREVVKSERLLRTDNSPGGAMSELLDATAFRHHPYHWPTVGWMRDLNAITLEEASAYHQNHYAPNNAYAVVVGDFDTSTVLKTIEANYGGLQAREVPAHTPPEEPRQTEERRDYLFKEVEADQTRLGYRVPGFAHEDWPVLEVLNQVLNGGKSSRLKQALIFGDEPIVSSISSSLLPIRDPYLYLWGFKMLPGHTNQEALDAISAGCDDLSQHPVSDKELEIAVSRLQSSVIREMLTNQQRADLIGFAVRTSDAPTLFFDRLSQYAAVLPADIQRVAADLLRASNRTVITAVSPSRLPALVALWVEAYPTPSIDPSLTEMVDLDIERIELADKARELESEADAIARLAQRAETAKDLAAADEKALTAIDDYLEKNEKGVRVRTERLSSARAAHDEATATVDARWAKSAKEAREIVEVSPGARAKTALLSLLIDGSDTEVSGALPTDTPAETAGAAVGLLMYSTWLDRQERIEEAARARSRAHAQIDRLTDASAEALAGALRALAHDTTRRNILPRSETLGGR